MILEKKEERNINLLFYLFTYSLVASCVCPDQGSNLQLWCMYKDDVLTNWATCPGLLVFLPLPGVDLILSMSKYIFHFLSKMLHEIMWLHFYNNILFFKKVWWFNTWYLCIAWKEWLSSVCYRAQESKNL